MKNLSSRKRSPPQGLALPAEGADSASTRDRRGTVVQSFSHAVAAIYRTASRAAGGRLSGMRIRGYFQVSLDEEQAPERELDALSLARAKQQPCGSGAPLLNLLRRGVSSGRSRLMM